MESISKWLPSVLCTYGKYFTPTGSKVKAVFNFCKSQHEKTPSSGMLKHLSIPSVGIEEPLGRRIKGVVS